MSSGSAPRSRHRDGVRNRDPAGGVVDRQIADVLQSTAGSGRQRRVHSDEAGARSTANRKRAGVDSVEAGGAEVNIAAGIGCTADIERQGGSVPRK